MGLVETLKGLKRATPSLVEHDMQAVFAALPTASRCWLEGRIIATGSPQQVREDAAVRAAYLGEAA